MLTSQGRLRKFMTVRCQRSALTLPLSLLLFFCLLSTGCSTRGGYRPALTRTHVGLELHTYDDKIKVAEREHESLEKYSDSNFWLGHVEMTDYGTYQGRADNQMSALEHAVGRERGKGLFKRGITIVVFVHGWSNNAQEDNSNLNSFRSLLSDVARNEKAHQRGVLGVYLSWRGASLPKALKLFTYWGRGRASEAIGQGIMVEALARIQNIHWLVATGASRSELSNLEIYRNSRLVLIGHSFGGRALYNAVAQGMETNFLRPYWAARSFPEAQGRGRSEASMPRVTGFGDLVLLINPAIKGLPYRKIHHAVSTNRTVNYDPARGGVNVGQNGRFENRMPDQVLACSERTAPWLAAGPSF